MTDNTEAPLLPEPLTGAQVRRLYDNSPGLHEDARSFAGFVRIVRLVESAYRIGDSVVPNPEPGASSQWQPIGTAPLGPVILLGYAPHPRMEGSRRVYEGKWNYEQQTWTSVNGFLVHTAATHWMPLPPPPGATLEPGARSPVDLSFDEWYARQRHQLTNEQVCRLIWRRGWGAAARQYSEAYQREEARADAAEQRAEEAETRLSQRTHAGPGASAERSSEGGA